MYGATVRSALPPGLSSRIILVFTCRYRVDAGAHKVLAPVKLTNVTKPSPPSSPAASNCTKRCGATKASCDCHCYCAVCAGKCGDGCYDKCHGSGGCKASCGDLDPEKFWHGVASKTAA